MSGINEPTAPPDLSQLHLRDYAPGITALPGGVDMPVLFMRK
jgi:hypothetical protein